MLLAVKPADFDVTVITCYPGTPYFDQAVPHADKPGVWSYTYKKTGDRLYQIAVDYATTADHYKGIPGDYHSYVFTDTLTPQDLVRERDRVENSVRAALGIPFYTAAAARQYEHSMGQSGTLIPQYILKQAGEVKQSHVA